ncbi:MAG: ribonuclease HI [Cyanobacteria bacterium SW_9_44_58]|nr:MAG: ribonuclease HI [Cyanobacteria bacterium SW_9_44_58]
MSTLPLIDCIYTDGACSDNPGQGGWGAVLYFQDGSIYELGGADSETTNNRMEMQAAIASLQLFHESGQTTPIALYSDSEYLIKGITQWLNGWKKKGWKTASGKAVLNQDLWKRLDQLNDSLVNWRHVSAHQGIVGNERCDAIARSFAAGNSPSLKQTIEFPVPANCDTVTNVTQTIQSKTPKEIPSRNTTNPMEELEERSLGDSPLVQGNRMEGLEHLIQSLRIADEIAEKGYLISSSELADLMNVNASAVTSRGNHWSWRNWVVSRVRREGNQILWQLERAEG